MAFFFELNILEKQDIGDRIQETGDRRPETGDRRESRAKVKRGNHVQIDGWICIGGLYEYK